MSDFPFKLPVGLLQGDELFMGYDVKEMTGRVRKVIGHSKYSNQMARKQEIILSMCVTQLEGEIPICEKTFKEAFVCDRDAILLMIRKVSKPDEKLKVVNLKCPSCKEKGIAIDVDYEDLTYKTFEESAYKFENGKVTLTIDQPGLNCKIRLPTGEDTNKISKLLLSNQDEALQKLLSICMIEWDGKKQFNPGFIDDLGVGKLDKLTKLLVEENPGYDMRIDVECPSCLNDIKTQLDPQDFF